MQEINCVRGLEAEQCANLNFQAGQAGRCIRRLRLVERLFFPRRRTAPEHGQPTGVRVGNPILLDARGPVVVALFDKIALGLFG